MEGNADGLLLAFRALQMLIGILWLTGGLILTVNKDKITQFTGLGMTMVGASFILMALLKAEATLVLAVSMILMMTAIIMRIAKSYTDYKNLDKGD